MTHIATINPIAASDTARMQTVKHKMENLLEAFKIVAMMVATVRDRLLTRIIGMSKQCWPEPSTFASGITAMVNNRS